jgi:hypothetical protein
MNSNVKISKGLTTSKDVRKSLVLGANELYGCKRKLFGLA